MKKSISILLATIMVLLSCMNGILVQAQNSFDEETLNQIIPKYIDERKEGTGSISLGVFKDGEVIYQHQYGYQDVENQVPLFNLISVIFLLMSLIIILLTVIILVIRWIYQILRKQQLTPFQTQNRLTALAAGGISVLFVSMLLLIETIQKPLAIIIGVLFIVCSLIVLANLVNTS